MERCVADMRGRCPKCGRQADIKSTVITEGAMEDFILVECQNCNPDFPELYYPEGVWGLLALAANPNPFSEEFSI